MDKLHSQTNDEYNRDITRVFHMAQGARDVDRHGRAEDYMEPAVLEELMKQGSNQEHKQDQSMTSNTAQINPHENKVINANRNEFNSSLQNQQNLNDSNLNIKFDQPNNLSTRIVSNYSNKVQTYKSGSSNYQIQKNSSLDNKMNVSKNNIQNVNPKSTQNDDSKNFSKMNINDNSIVNKSTRFSQNSSPNSQHMTNLNVTGPILIKDMPQCVQTSKGKKKKNDPRSSQKTNFKKSNTGVEYIYHEDDEEVYNLKKINKNIIQNQQLNQNSNCYTSLSDVTWQTHEQIDFNLLYQRVFNDINKCTQYSYKQNAESITVLESEFTSNNNLFAVKFVFEKENDKIHVLFPSKESKTQLQFNNIKDKRTYRVKLERKYEITFIKDAYICGIYLFFGFEI